MIFVFAVVSGGMTSTAADEAPTSISEDGASSIEFDNGLSITSADGNYGLQANGILQLRYGFESVEGEAQHSSFYLRRLRIDLRGHAFSDRFTFRLMPEFSRTAALRDGWVSYWFHRGFQLRAGQFTVPFNWERHTPPMRHQFVERSTANNMFQWPTGRDIGVMAHGDPLEGLRYGVGVFSGQGINAPRSESPGHLLSGRLSYAIVGDYQLTEVLIEPAEQINFAVSGGAYVAFENSSQEWGVWEGMEVGTADLLAGTADIQMQISRVSLHLAGFYRSIVPVGMLTPTIEGESATELPDSVSPRLGYGYTAHAGVLVVPERLFASLRVSESQPDLDEDFGRQAQALVGVQLFHRGHDSKFHIEGGLNSEHNGSEWRDGYAINLQYQFLF